MKKVSIVTVNYNQPAVTEQLLHSIEHHCKYPQLEIIVVDNGSTEDHTLAWSARFPAANFIRSNENLGFAGGNNLGIAATNGDYLFLVNNDTEFTPDLVETLVKTLDDNSSIGMVSPKICYYNPGGEHPDMIQYIGFTPMNMYTAQNASPGQFESDKGQYDHQLKKTGFAHGAAMMIRRSAMEKAGVMAENFFLYYEEMDWCERFRRCGYEIWVNTDALIYHKESVSVGRKSALKEYFMNRNRMLFIRRNAPLPALFFFTLYFLFLVVPRNILVYINEKNYSFIPVLLRAVWWNLTHSKDSTDLGYSLKTIK